MMKPLRIGEVSKRANVGIETIRYYEREGLLSEPERKPSDFRQYDEFSARCKRAVKRTGF